VGSGVFLVHQVRTSSTLDYLYLLPS